MPKKNENLAEQFGTSEAVKQSAVGGRSSDACQRPAPHSGALAPSMTAPSLTRRRCAQDQRYLQLLPRFMFPTTCERAASTGSLRSCDVPRATAKERQRRRIRRHGRQSSLGRRGNWGPWSWLAVDSVVLVLFLFVGVLRAVADEIVDIRPVWMSLEGHDAGASVAEVFRSSEVLQMYHLQVCMCGMGPRSRVLRLLFSGCWRSCVAFHRVLLVLLGR